MSIVLTRQRAFPIKGKLPEKQMIYTDLITKWNCLMTHVADCSCSRSSKKVNVNLFVQLSSQNQYQLAQI